MNISDAVIQLHNIARLIHDEAPNESFQIRRVADNLHGSVREKKENEERGRSARTAPRKTMIVNVNGEDND
jgi:hypothetical protein